MRDVYLKQPLNRGNIAAPAGETVSVPDGLGQRLIDRGRACDPKDAPMADPKPAAKADDKPAAKAPAKGGDKGDGKAPPETE